MVSVLPAGGPIQMSSMAGMRTNSHTSAHNPGSMRSRMGPSAGGMHGASHTGNGIPFSARRSKPLDLSTVERRGQANAAREVGPKLNRPHGIQEAPTFKPTEEEFKDPMKYIQSLAEEGKKYGIIKIIPPDSWNPDFAINTEIFHFETRKQELNMAEGGTRANLTYLDALAKFHKQRNGTNFNRLPSVDKRPLDLYKLKKLVEDKGGFDTVCKQKRWAEVGRDLGYSGKIMSSLSTSLKNSYQKWLQPYEEWLSLNKPGVLQQQELENGGPYTPSPGVTPIRTHQNTPQNFTPVQPAVQASLALHATLHNGDSSHSGPVQPAEQAIPARPAMTSGFTAVNAGGFTAVNAPQSGFSAINAPSQAHRENLVGMSTPAKSIDSPLTSLDNTPEFRSSYNALGLPPTMNGHGFSPLKRQLSTDDESNEPDAGEGADATQRRSKRIKKDAPPTVTGSHMMQPRLPVQRLHPPRDRANETPGEKCEKCLKGDDRYNMLICEDCKAGYHRYCLDTPLKAKPEEDWYCPRCLVCFGDFGFQKGDVYSLSEFQERDRLFREKHFKDKLSYDPITNARRQPSEEDVEREFWRLTESLDGLEPVEYGADLHSAEHGSGFPTLEKGPDSYARDPWNLNILPRDKESLFRHIGTDIDGMIVPWLYVGMCFSTFCWHSEDHYTYSINYQHFGATKTWYGIPGDDADRFEAAMKDAVPDLFEQQPDLLFQLVTLLQPEKIKNAGVRVYALDQRAGQFVITFPGAYHAGFNQGFNFNEAVNFAPSDWEPWGATAYQRLQDFRRPPVFSHDELLITATNRDHSIKTAKWLGPALERLRNRELSIRADFQRELQKLSEQSGEQGQPATKKDEASELPFEVDTSDHRLEEIACAYCKTFCYLSRFVCKSSGHVLCLMHAGNFECCPASAEGKSALTSVDGKHPHLVQLRLSDSDLTTIVQKVVDVSNQPEAWAAKLDSVLGDSDKPQLKSLKTLVAEGEKINSHWPLEPLPELKKFVERCNEWVEEATNYIVRKQQNRRKNERAWRKSTSKQNDADDREKEARNADNIKRLLATADDLAFDCPELDTLREKAEQIGDFRRRAGTALSRAGAGVQELNELIEEGKNFGLDMPEVERLEKKVRTVKWYEDAQDYCNRISEGTSPSLKEIKDFIQRGKDLGIQDQDTQIAYFLELKAQGEFWENKAKELMAVEEVNFQQLDDLSKQASRLPVSKETLAAIDAILQKQRDAQERIVSLYERSREVDFRQRPMYNDVLKAMSALEELNSKPPGTMDLEKEQKRHEDWMRRGKKLFGKTNAPLHILHQHMKYVEERNDSCLDLRDLPRMPVEPSSRANSPDGEEVDNGSGSVRDVFCICRKPEAGMMIECEMCHEWYHGKCLKIARGKVKEDDKYTCPICDYRVKIPRDATRPKIEELENWQDEIPGLPFQPEEEDTLRNIIDVASAFRAHVAAYLNPLVSTPDDLPVQRFYLRKIEGCEILLAEETNFFRAQVHKWAPVAPNPPPMLASSLSTRKPRPTKLQKQMKELGITNVEDLPEHLRPKPPGVKKKTADAKKAASVISSGQRSDVPSRTPPGLPHGLTLDASSLQATSGALSASAIAGVNPNRPPSAFTFDALAATTGFQPHSPLFASASGVMDFKRDHHHIDPHHHHHQPSLHHSVSASGIDPQLADMFAEPSGPGGDGAVGGGDDGGFDIFVSGMVHSQDDAAGAQEDSVLERPDTIMFESGVSGLDEEL